MSHDRLFDDHGQPSPTARAALAARDEALDRVDAHADPEWKDVADRVIRRLADTMREFTADDVRDALPDGVWTHEPRALGPRMLAAARAGLIERTDRSVTSRHRNGGLARVWRSTKFTEAPGSGDIDSVDDARLDPTIVRRATIGYTLDWDPYGDADVSDALRLELVADYLERVNTARQVENRVPGDLRRIAARLRDD